MMGYVGSWSEYAKSPDHLVALKPKSLSFSDAASLPLAATTALQALKKYKGSLAGKTVFVPAGREFSSMSDWKKILLMYSIVSGTGNFALQLAKNVFGAGKVITTVSTGKIPKVPKLLGEGVVDQSTFCYHPLSFSLSLCRLPSYRPHTHSDPN